MNEQTTVATKRDLIEQNISKVFPGGTSVAISETSGGLAFRTMDEVIAGSKMMSMAGPAIPLWLQGNAGSCWAIILQSNQWGMDPISVARQSYEVNGVICYQAQLIHALIEKRAPLQRRLRFSYSGEGQDRQVEVIGHIIGEVHPLVYLSPPLGKISPKKSPLWQTDPDQQLAYYGSRAWCRRYCPDVILSVYDREEMPDRPIGAANARDVTAASALHERLAAAAAQGEPREGFNDAIGQGESFEVDVVPKEAVDQFVAEGGYVEDASEPAGEPEPPEGGRGSRKPRKRTSGAPRGREKAPQPKPRVAKVEKSARVASVKAEPAKAPPLPSDVSGYIEHVRHWLMTHHDEQSIEGQWRAEMRLRNQCGITQADREAIRALVDARVQQVRE